jgi:hypothetical protein
MIGQIDYSQGGPVGHTREVQMRTRDCESIGPAKLFVALSSRLRRRALNCIFLTLTMFMSISQGAEWAENNKSVHWKLPRTQDGQPNLQGIWTNGTLTPLERMPELAQRAFFTEQEFAAQEALAEQRGQDIRHPEGVGTDNDEFFDNNYKLFATRQTSLIVDPPDGRLPLRADQAERSDSHAISLDSYESMSPWERCISLGPTMLFPKLINNGYQIIQTRDYVVIAPEMINDTRVIPFGNGPHLDLRIKSWNGDSRAHWEGATLVIDTTNFSDRRMVTSIALGAARNLPQTETLHTVERFTRIDANTLEYRITFEDPKVFSAPWTVSFPFTRDHHYRIFEYACHEGNYDVEGMLRGARVQEEQAARDASK